MFVQPEQVTLQLPWNRGPPDALQQNPSVQGGANGSRCPADELYATCQHSEVLKTSRKLGSVWNDPAGLHISVGLNVGARLGRVVVGKNDGDVVGLLVVGEIVGEKVGDSVRK